MPTTVPAALAILASALRLRAGLAGVGVHLMDGPWPESELIVFTQVTAPQAWVYTSEPGSEETATLTGEIFAELAGSGDIACVAAQARAGVILDELVDQLHDDPDVGGAVPAGMAAPLLTQATWTTAGGDTDGTGKVGVQINWTITWTGDL